MARIKEYNREERKRKQRSVVCIVCEGTQTEPKYFNNFKTRYCNVEIVPCPSQYKNASKLVQKATSSIGKREYHPEYGDSMWCVFDRDANTNAELQKAKEAGDSLGYRIIFSNPSFELWFLNHFVNQGGHLEDCDAVIAHLKMPGRIPGYSKNQDYFELLLPLQETAIQNSIRGLKRLERDGVQLFCRESNPATNVQELVAFLKNVTA